jgi:uncharacterized protein involved in response to NO
MNAIPRLKAYQGSAFLSYGFRPFFFLGACYAALAVALWLPIYEGEFTLPTAFAPRDWHVHEMLFGYVAAVVTGFLLTAVPNWTGRLPLQGVPLLTLVLAWLAGRIAVSLAAKTGWVVSGIVDCAFLILVVGAVAREIVAGRNWRNLKVLIPVSAFALANIGFHVEAYAKGVADLSVRFAIAAIVSLIMLIGGRVVPSFTRNWLSRQKSQRLPAPFDKVDAAAIGFGVASLCLWAISPEGGWTSAALMVSALVHCLRLARWGGDQTGRDWLVLVLHVAYGFIPLGFLLLALGALQVLPQSAGLHAWMVGAAGTMTLAVMTRASLGHTGRELIAGPGTRAIYAAVVLAAFARIAAVLLPQWAFALLHVSAVMWLAAFGGFALLYGPLLFQKRISGSGASPA